MTHADGRRLAGVELGGTKVLVTLKDGANDAAAPVRIETRAPDETLQDVVRALEALSGGAPIHAIGIAAFGPLELDPAKPGYGRLLTTPKALWAGVDLLGPLLPFGARLSIETDVNAAALAEGRWGAARGLRDHAYITIGTGVGVGVVSGGAPVHGAGHPEGGHLAVVRSPGDGFSGSCPWHGACVEGMISGAALAKRFARPPAELAADDPVWVWGGDYLAQLCAALVYLQAPEAIVVGGGVGRRVELVDRARTALLERLGGYLPRLNDHVAVAALVRPAHLENAGLMGALHLAEAALGSTSPL